MFDASNNQPLTATDKTAMFSRSNSVGLGRSSTMATFSEVKRKLQDLEERIAEAERRLPAHSAKPTTMMMLLDLEDERDRLVAQIETPEASTSHHEAQPNEIKHKFSKD